MELNTWLGTWKLGKHNLANTNMIQFTKIIEGGLGFWGVPGINTVGNYTHIYIHT